MSLLDGMMKGINLGGWLSQCGEKYNENHYNTFITEEDIKKISDMGLDHVRVPVDYNVVQNEDGSFIESGFKHLDDCISWCKKYNLKMVLDLHKTCGFIFDDASYCSFFTDEKLIDMFKDLKARVEEQMEGMQFPNALVEIWKCVSRLNKYIDETAPWALAKDEANNDRLAQVMYVLLEGIRIVGILIQPFMPRTPAKIFKMLGIEGNEALTSWDAAGTWGLYQAGTLCEKGDPIFPRLDLAKELDELEAIKTAQAEAAKAAEVKTAEVLPTDEITIDDFAKVQLVVAKVLEAEAVEGSNKLLKMKVDIGSETRQVVSGIAKTYTPADMIGRKVIFIKNLKPAKLKGIISEGMILAASEGDKLSLATVAEDMPVGAKIS